MHRAWIHFERPELTAGHPEFASDQKELPIGWICWLVSRGDHELSVPSTLLALGSIIAYIVSTKTQQLPAHGRELWTRRS